MRSLSMLVVLLCWTVMGLSQEIISGPVLGGVTETTARIYYRTDVPADLRIELATDSDFTETVDFFSATSPDNEYAVITHLTGLTGDTRYYYRVFVGEVLYDTLGYFRTFPQAGQPGYYRVVVGSCNYDNFRNGGGATSDDNYMNDVLFGSIKEFDPHLVIHLGDWNYPPSRFGADFNLFPDKRADAFSFRYEDYNFRKYIQPHFPIDYMYDDSYSYNGSAGWTWPRISTETLPNGQTKYVLTDEPMDPGIRTGNIEGYFDHFPGYQQVDTSGVHHSFMLGNIEFFITDTRNSKDPVHAGFRYNETLNIYTWQAPAGHSTLGSIQRDWLLNGLRNSQADWKIIGSSVVFNKRMRDLINIVLAGQLIDRSLVEFATAISYMWAGYPSDMFSIIDAVNEDSIENVIVLSGDTHSSMLDDGSNSGIPEVSSSGWAAGNEGYLNKTIDDLFGSLGLPYTTRDFLWNGGGTGVANDYIGDSYATLEFFYQDSMRACIVDEFDQILSCMTILYEGERDSSGVPTAISYIPELDFRLIYPNPARDRIHIQFGDAISRAESVELTITGSDGRVYQNYLVSDRTEQHIVQITDLAHGVYLLSLEVDGEAFSRRFVKH